MSLASASRYVASNLTPHIGCMLLAIALPLAAVARPSQAPDLDTTAALGADDVDARANDAPFEGTVVAYALSPEAGVAGLIFDNGRQVSVPPHLGSRLAALIQPGQQARVGARRDAPRGPGSLRSITSVATGETLVDLAPDDPQAPPSPGRDAARCALQPMHVAGAIRLRLHGPRGETNGLLLDTGAQILFPPHVSNEAGTWLRPGVSIGVDGYGCTSGYGTVVQATKVAGPGGVAVDVYGPAGAPPVRR